jgi:hypothetical protein
MLTKEEINKIARFTGFSPFQQEKLYLQTILLKSFYSNFDAIFKGGTALLFGYGLNRFSEDLDFTAINPISIDQVEKSLTEDLTLLGINAIFDISSQHPMGISLRIGCEGPLFIKESQRCYIRIDISYREPILISPIAFSLDPIYPDLLPFSIKLMNKNEIASEKIRAILTRNQARDIYDLAFLIKKGINITIDQINSKLSYYKKVWNINEFQEAVEKKQAIWIKELKPIIIGPLSDFSEIIQEIIPFLSQL